MAVVLVVAVMMVTAGVRVWIFRFDTKNPTAKVLNAINHSERDTVER